MSCGRPNRGHGKIFRATTDRPTVTEVAAYYERKIGCVIFPVDSERASGDAGIQRGGRRDCGREQRYDRFFASIDPAKGRMGAREARRLIRDFGVKGFKFHPSLQEFFPNDRSAYVLYEAIAEAGAPGVVPHGPDGRGRRNARRRRRPPEILQPDVSWTMSPSIFPTCRSSSRIPPFPGRMKRCRSPPTSRRSISTCRAGRRSTFRILVQYANSILKHKMLFGSDYPMITGRWLADFETIPIKPDVRPLILKENAVKLLKLDKTA